MITKETYMFCDFCGLDYEPGDNYSFPGWKIRKKAKKDGWKYVNAKDKCLECIKAKRTIPMLY